MTIAIPEKQYFKIGEVSEILNVEPYVLRYWESEFKILKPTRTLARQRLYHKRDLELLMEIKHLLYDEKFTIARPVTDSQHAGDEPDHDPAEPSHGREARLLRQALAERVELVAQCPGQPLPNCS